MIGVAIISCAIFAWAALDAPAEFCLAVAVVGVIASLFSAKPQRDPK